MAKNPKPPKKKSTGEILGRVTISVGVSLLKLERPCEAIEPLQAALRWIEHIQQHTVKPGRDAATDSDVGLRAGF